MNCSSPLLFSGTKIHVLSVKFNVTGERGGDILGKKRSEQNLLRNRGISDESLFFSKITGDA